MIKKIYEVLDKKQRVQVFFILVVIFISSLLELMGVGAIFPLITVITNPDVINSNPIMQWVMQSWHLESGAKLAVVMLLGVAAIYVIKNLYILWMNRVVFRFIYDNQARVASKMFESYIYQDLQFHYEHNVAELNRNVEFDVENFFYALQSILQLVTEILVCILLVAYLAFKDFETTMIMAVLMTFLVLLFLLVFKKRMKYYGAKSRSYLEEKSKWFLQSFNGIKEIKTIGKEPYFLGQYRSNYFDYAKVQQRQQLLNCVSKPMVEMICISGMLVFMAIRILMGADLAQFVPTLSVFAMAAFRMMPSFNRISGYLNAIMFKKPSVEAVYHNLQGIRKMAVKHDNEEMQDTKSWVLKEGISVEDVSFAYAAKPDIRILNGVSIQIPVKKSVAFVGGSGAGKTTLADIILGLYQPGSGRILVDGKDIHEDMNAWRRAIGYIPQNIYLLDDTIRANIALGVSREKADDDKIWAVLEEAQLADFIREQKDGLDTNIGDRGVKLSGGQRQRIGIARALYTDPELLVLDEATSALDTETETAVMDAIFRLSGKVTMIVIAHRITTIRNCDHIYRIADGQATEVTYQEIAEK